MKMLAYSILTVILAFSLSISVNAQKNWTGAAGNNSWGDDDNWSPAGVPNPADAVTIGSGFTLVVDDSSYTCAAVNFTTNASDSRLEINSGGELTVAGVISYSNPSIDNVHQTILVSGTGSLACNEITMANCTNGGLRTNVLTIGDGTVTVMGNINTGGAVNENFVLITGSGTLTIAGTLAGGTFDAAGAGSTVYWIGDNTGFRSATYHHLVIQLPAGATTNRDKASGAALTVNGNLTIESLSADYNVRLNTGGANLTVEGNTILRPRSHIIDNNNSGTNTFNGTVKIEELGLISTGNNSPYVFNDTLTNVGTFNITGAGTFTFRKPVENSGTFTKTGTGTITTETNAVTFTNNSTFEMLLAGAVAVNVKTTLAGNGPIRFTGNISLASGDTLTNANTEAINGVTITGVLNGHNDNSSVYINQGITTYASATQPMVNGTLDTENFIPNLFVYSSGVAQTVKPNTYHHLAKTGTNTATLSGNTLVNGDFSLLTGTFNPGNFDFTVAGSSSIGATFADATLDGTTTLSNVDLSGGTFNGGANGVVNITGNLSLPSAHGTIGRVDLNINGNTTIADGRILTINSANGPKVFNGPVTIDGQLTVSAAAPLTFNNDVVVAATGTWLNSGNASPVLAGNLTVANGAIFTQGTGTYTFNGTAKELNGTIGALTFSNLAVTGTLLNRIPALTLSTTLTVTAPGTLSNNHTLTTSVLAGTGTFIQANSATLNISGNPSIAQLNATADGNSVNFTGAAQNIPATTYYNLACQNSNTKTLQGNASILGNLTIANGVTFSLGILATTVSVTGTTDIEGTLAFAGTIAKLVTLNNDLTGLGTINMNSGNSTILHQLNLGGQNNAIGTFTIDNYAHTIRYNRNGNQTVFPSATYRQLIVDNPGTKSLTGDITVTHGLSIAGGVLSLDGHTLISNQDVVIGAGTELYISPGARLLLATTRTLTNNGTFSMIGLSGNLAEAGILGAGTWFYNQSTPGALLRARYALFNNLNGGLSITDGAVDPVYNFSYSTFASGTGAQYIQLSGLDMAGFPAIETVTFNSGPSYNVSRTSGTGSLTFNNSTGVLAGENFDNDNGNPGTLIHWDFPASTYYSAGDFPAGLTTSWTRNPDGTGPNPPSITDGLASLIVQDGHTVTVDNNGNLDVKNLQVGQGTSGTLRIGADATQRQLTVRELLTINSGATLNAGSTGSPAHQLLIYGNMVNHGNFNLRPSPASIVNTEIFGNTIISGTASPVFNDLTFKSGTSAFAEVALDVNANLFIETSASFNDGGLEHTVAGNWIVTGTGNYVSSGTLVFDGMVNTIADNPSSALLTFNNIIFRGAGAGSIQENIMVNGHFTVENNTAVTIANNSVTVNSDFTIGPNSSYNHTANYTYFNGTGLQDIQLAGTVNFTNLAFNNGGGMPKTITGDLSVGTWMIINDGSTVGGSGSHTLTNLRMDGTCTFSGAVNLSGTLTTNSATNEIVLGTAALNINNNSTLTFGGSASSLLLRLNNNLNISGGYLVINNNCAIIGQPGYALSMTGNYTLYCRGIDNFPTGFGAYNLPSSSWIRYDVALNQTIRGGIIYGNLQLGGASSLKTVDGPLNIKGVLQLSNAITLNLQSFSHSLEGSLLNGSNSSINGPLADFALSAPDAAQNVESCGTGSYVFRNLTISLSNATATRTKTFAAGAGFSLTNGNLILVNNGGTPATRLIADPGNNSLGGTPQNLEIGEYCQLNVVQTDPGASFFDRFAATKNLDPNSTVYYSLLGAQTIADGFDYGHINFNGGNKTASGPLTIRGDISRTAGTPVFIDNGFAHTIAGNWLLNNTGWYTATSATGTIIFNGTDQTINGANFNNVTIANSGTASIVNPITLFGDLNVSAGGAIDFDVRNLTIGGNITINPSGLFTQSTGITTFNGGATQAITFNSNSYFGRITVNKPNPAGQQGVTALTTLRTQGLVSLTANAGLLDLTGQQVYFGGGLRTNANTVEGISTVIATNSTVTFDGADVQYIDNNNPNPLVFNNIIFTGTGDKYLDVISTTTDSRRFEVTGNFTISGSVVRATGRGNGGMDIYVWGNWVNSGSFLHNNSRTVFFTGGNQTITSTAFWNVDFGGTNKKMLLGSLAVNNSLTISSDTLQSNNFNITVDGNWTNTAASGVFLPGTGKVIFNGGAATIATGAVTPTAGKGFYQIEINKNAATATLGGALEVAGDLTINSGTLTTGANSIWLSGDFINNGGTFNHNNNTSVLNLIASGGSRIFQPNGGTFRSIVMDAPGATYHVQSNFAITNVNMNLTAGELRLNSNQLTLNDNTRQLLINGGVLHVDSASTIMFNNANQVINLTSGELRLVGSESGIASLIRPTGTFALNQSGGSIHARYYLVRNGNITISSGTIDATENFSNGTFASGSGAAYLTLTGLNFADFSVNDIVFNPGPTRNIARTSGIGTITIEDASGGLAGELYELDNGVPGTLIDWTFPSGFYWDGEAITDNWHDALNWSGNTIPTDSSIVYLNHDYVAGAYTVKIRTADAVTKRVNLDANGGQAITLEQESGYDLTIREHLQIGTGCTHTISDVNSLVYIGKNYTNLGTFNHGNSTVVFNGIPGFYNIVAGGTGAGKRFYNLTIDAADNAVYNLGSVLGTDNNLTITKGTLNLASGNNDIWVSGNWVLDAANGAVFTPSTADVTFDGADQTITNGNFYNLLTTGSGTKSVLTNIAITNDATIEVNTTFNGLDNTLYIGRHFTNNGTFAQHDYGTVILNGIAAQNFGLGSSTTTFNHLMFTNAGQKNLMGPANVAGDITINGGSGAVNLDVHTINGLGPDNSLVSFGTLHIRGAANFPQGFETIDLAATSNTIYIADIDQTVYPTIYGSLTLRRALAGTTTKTAGGNLEIRGNLNMNNDANTILNAEAFDAYIKLTGTINLTAGNQINWGTGTSTLEHIGGNWSISANLAGFNNLILNGTGNKYMQGNLSITGNVTVKSGAYLRMYQNNNQANFRTMTGEAGNIFTVESAGRVYCATPAASGDAVPTGFSTYNLSATSNYYLFSPNGVHQTLFTGSDIRYGNLIFSYTKNITMDGIAKLVVLGNLNTQTATLFDNGRDIEVAGSDIYLNYYTPSSSARVFTLNGFQSQYLRGDQENTIEFGTINFAGSGIKTLGDGNDVIIILGNLSITNGVTVSSARNITFTGETWANNGIFTHTANAVTFNRNSAQAINPGTPHISNRFNNVVFSNNSEKTFITHGADINGNMTINAGTTNLGNLTHFMAGQLTNTAGGTLVSANANLVLDGGNQSINTPSFQINNITISGTGTKRLFSDWTINGDLLVTSGSTLNTYDNIGTYSNIFIKGHWTIQGTYTNNTSTVTFNGSQAAVDITGGGSNFYDVVIAPTVPAQYNLLSPFTRIRRSADLSASSTLFLSGNDLILGSNLSAAKLFTINGTLRVNENASLRFNNQGSQSVLNVPGRLELIGTSSSAIALLSREVAGSAGSETQINILPGGTLAAQYYLIEYLQDAGLTMQPGSILDATHNLSNGTWSNIRVAPNVRYLTLEADYSGGAISDITFNFTGTPVQGTHFNVHRETALPDITFNVVGGNLGSFKFEKDEEAVPSPTSGKLRWPAVTETNWTGAVNTNWHLDGNWDNGVPTATVDAIIPSRPNNPIISDNDASCKNFTITTGTVILDNGRNLTTSGDISIGTGTSVGILSVATQNSTIYAGGLWTRGLNGLYLHGSSTVVFNSGAGSATITPRVSAFYDVVVDNPATTFYLSGSPITIDGKFDILNGEVVPTTNNYFINVKGDISFTGGTFIPTQGAVTAGTIVLSGTGPQTVTDGIFHHLQVFGSDIKSFDSPVLVNGITTINSTFKANPGAPADFRGNLTINAGGTFDDGGETHTFNGAIWTGLGNYTGNGTIILNRTIGNQQLNKSSFNNLIIDCTSRSLIINDSIKVTGNVLVKQGITQVNPGTQQIINTSGSGIFEMEPATPLYLTGADNYPKGFSDYIMAPNSAVYYNGAVDQLVAGVTYGVLHLNNNTLKTLKGDVAVQGNLNFNLATLDVSPNSYNLTIGGAWNNASGNFVCRTGEVTFNGTGNQAINFGAANLNTFYDISIAKPGNYVHANNNVSNSFTVENNLMVTSGQFHANGRVIFIGGDLMASGSGSFHNNTGTYYLNRNAGTARIGVNGSSLNNLTINSPGNATYTMLDNLVLVGDFNLIGGTFNGSGREVWLGNGYTDVVNIAGTYRVGPGGTMALGNGVNLTVEPTGRFEVVGNTSQIARVTRNTSGGRYTFTVNGQIAARYYLFEYMSASGIYLTETATIDAVNNFSDGTFTLGANTGQLLRVENTQSFSGPDSIANVSFPVNPGGAASNVAKFAATSGTLEFYNATGVFAGETYDNDPYNLINWTGPVILTWNGSVSTNWFDSLNWTANFGPPIVPTGNENVIIAPATNQPVLTTFGAKASNLTINNGAFVTLNTAEDAGDIDLDVNGDIVINGTLRLLSAGDYLNVEGSWTRATTGTVILNGNVTFDGSGGAKVINNRGTGFKNLTISGTSQYLLGFNTTVTGNLAIDAGATLDVTTANHNLTVLGNWTNNGAFLANTGKVTLDGSTLPVSLNGGSSPFYDLDINTGTATVLLSGDLYINHNLNLIAGTLDLNQQRLYAGDNVGIDNIGINGILQAGPGSQIIMGNNARINVNNGGVLSLVGTDPANRAYVTALANNRYSFDINSGGILHARYYSISNTNANGLYLQSGAITDSVNNLSDGIFINGFPGSGTYLKLEHNPAWGDDTIRYVTFNTGPLYNVDRTTGSSVFFFQDAAGPLGSYEYENDIVAPDPGSGLLRWPYLNTYIWTGAVDDDWHKTGNWLGSGIPDDTKNAIIPAAVLNYPLISTAPALSRNITLQSGAMLTIANSLEITEDIVYQGELIAIGSPLITIGQNWTDDGGSFVPGNSTIRLQAGGGMLPLGLIAGSFYNLTIDAIGATYLLNNTLNIQNNLTVDAGLLNLNGINVNIGGSLINSGTLVTGNQLLTFNGASGTHTINTGGASIYNLTINSVGGGATYRVADHLTVLNNFTLTRGTFSMSSDGGATSYNLTTGNRWINNGGTFNAFEAEISIGENWLVSGGGIFNPGNSVVRFTATTGNRTISPASTSFYDLEFTGTASFRLAGHVTVLGNLTIASGILDAATAPSYNITLAGNWTNNSTFLPRNGTVSFNGTNQTISNTGTEEFYNFTFSGTNLLLNTSVVVSNTLNFTSGHINTQANRLTLGTGTGNTGSLNYGAGSITGEFERWLSALETDYAFPVGTSLTQNVAIVRFISSLTAGSLLTQFVPSTPGTAGMPVTDNGMPVDQVFTDGYWRFTARNALASADYNISLNGQGFISHAIDTATRVLKRTNGGNWNVQGTHQAAAGTVCHRRGLNGLSTVTTDFCLAIISCTGGFIGANDTICSGDDVPPFANLISPTGGSSPIYTWQITAILSAVPGDANWTDIPTSNTLALDYGILNQTSKFVRRTNATDCPTTYSNVIEVFTYHRPDTGPVHHIPNE